MSNLHDEDTRLTPDDEAFVRRVADAYAPPHRTASQRVAFQAKLEDRLRGGRQRARLLWGLAASATVAGALFLLRADPTSSPIDVDSPAVVVEMATAPSGDAAVQQEAILALAIDPESSSNAALPAEYEAIASVFLGG